MIINEKVKITVVANGKKYQRIVFVQSDGAYFNVKSIIEKFVGKEFTGYKVESISWNYVQ